MDVQVAVEVETKAAADAARVVVKAEVATARNGLRSAKKMQAAAKVSGSAKMVETANHANGWNIVKAVRKVTVAAIVATPIRAAAVTIAATGRNLATMAPKRAVEADKAVAAAIWVAVQNARVKAFA